MERLATVPMPPGIRPQMTPPASIMGQILHVGLHRRKGPQGGDLAAVGNTGLVAERVEADGEIGRSTCLAATSSAIGPRRGNASRLQNLAWEGTPPGERAAFVVPTAVPTRSRFRTPLEERMDLRTTVRLGAPPAAAQAARHRRSDRHGRRHQAVSGAGRSRQAAGVQRLAAGDRSGDQGQQSERQRRVPGGRPEANGRCASSAGSARCRGKSSTTCSRCR